MRLKVQTLQIAILVLIVAVSVATAAYAVASLTWTKNNRIQVVTPHLAVYQDASLTQPVADPIDWGVVAPGNQLSVNWWIKNEGGAALTLSWSSDLNSNLVNGLVSDTFSWNDGSTWKDLNGYSLAPGAVLAARYAVTVATLTPAGTYSWGLTLQGS
jgi:hypothetical protein